jgi:hypothetical protein
MGKNCNMISFIICLVYQNLLGWSNDKWRDEQGTREFGTAGLYNFGQKTLKESGHLGNLNIDERIILK